jgi:hypothetical protein
MASLAGAILGGLVTDHAVIRFVQGFLLMESAI